MSVSCHQETRAAQQISGNFDLLCGAPDAAVDLTAQRLESIGLVRSASAPFSNA
jgi:hypothetical protein